MNEQSFLEIECIRSYTHEEGQIEYVIIGIIVGDSNDGYASMITYMLFYISMNLGTFACMSYLVYVPEPRTFKIM
ncbi:hypothetical protein R6Q57_016573 [Mikania cordata]